MKKYLTQVCTPSAHKILILGSLYSFVKELLKSICWTQPRERVISTNKFKFFSPLRKTTQKSSWKTLIFGQEKKSSLKRKVSQDNLDQLLTTDNLLKIGFHVKVVLKTSSGNVLMRTPHHERTKCLVRQI